ncbi:refilin-A isoform X2 [Elephas maximus indicus]|uniref:refilin-A isoform X2 n=1 Tax=Elephas maximus indicus TaxID=99487 RepID=UPI0021170262|nr:refilin-A isoform X2 [Elephas maximus indicus]
MRRWGVGETLGVHVPDTPEETPPTASPLLWLVSDRQPDAALSCRGLLEGTMTGLATLQLQDISQQTCTDMGAWTEPRAGDQERSGQLGSALCGPVPEGSEAGEQTPTLTHSCPAELGCRLREDVLRTRGSHQRRFSSTPQPDMLTHNRWALEHKQGGQGLGVKAALRSRSGSLLGT